MGEEQTQNMLSRSFWGFIVRWMGVLAVGLLVGAGLGFLYVERTQSSTTSKFDSEAFLQVRYRVSPSGGIQDQSNNALRQEIAIIATQVNSTPVLESVVEKLPPEWNLTASELSSRISVTESQRVNVTGLPTVRVSPAVLVPGISLPTFSIRVTDSDPKNAQILANAIAQALMEHEDAQTILNNRQAFEREAEEIGFLETSIALSIENRKAVESEMNATTDEARQSALNTELQIIDLRLVALESTYQNQLSGIGRDRVQLARLGPQLNLLQEAPIGIGRLPRIRKREAMAVGGLVGLALAWALANIMESVQATHGGRSTRKSGTPSPAPSPDDGYPDHGAVGMPEPLKSSETES